MGQYFMPILGDAYGMNCKVFNRTVDGKHTFAKIMEHSWWLNPFVNSFSKRIYKKKSRVCWVGDYACEDDFDFMTTTAFYKPCYRAVWGEGVRTISSKSVDFTLDGKFLLNHDTKEFIDLNEYKEKSRDKDGWTIHPLPLLTAVGNDRGSGDFHEGNVGFKNVGIWAWCLISIAEKVPKGYRKIDVVFKEERAA